VYHIGTVRAERELGDLIHVENDFIPKADKQLYLFDWIRSERIMNINQVEFLGVLHGFVHEDIHKLMILIGFAKVRLELLLDLGDRYARAWVQGRLHRPEEGILWDNLPKTTLLRIDPLLKDMIIEDKIKKSAY